MCNIASCGSIGVEWFGNAADCSYGIENHQRLYSHTHTKTRSHRNIIMTAALLLAEHTAHSNINKMYCVKVHFFLSIQLISYICESGFGSPAEYRCFLTKRCSTPFLLSLPLGFIRMCLSLAGWFICVYVAGLFSDNSSAIVSSSSTLIKDGQTDSQTKHGDRQTDNQTKHGDRQTDRQIKHRDRQTDGQNTETKRFRILEC